MMLWILETEKAESISRPGWVFLNPHPMHAELTSLDNATHTASCPISISPSWWLRKNYSEFLKHTWLLQTLPTNCHLLLCFPYLSLSPSSHFSNDSSKITHSAHLIDLGRLQCLSTNPQRKRIMRSGLWASYQLQYLNSMFEILLFVGNKKGQKQGALIEH